ncbi:hypothetical protein ABEF95_004783 [Exophiala dermatitidis]
MGLERGMQAVVTATVFNALALLFIILRCISRFAVIRRAGLEEGLIIFALVLSFCLTVLIGLQKEHGLGRHSWTVSDEDQKDLSKLLYASILVYNLGLFLVKISILYQYLRFFVQKSFRTAAWFLIVFIVVAGLAMLLTFSFSCWPLAFFWDKTVQSGHCINLIAFWFCVSALHIATDLAILVLPMPVLTRLQLPRKQKMTLIGVFALGGFGCITSILRLHALYISSTSSDLTHDNVDAATWSSAELNVGIMCACIPAMRPVISVIFPRLLGTSRRGNTSDPYPCGAAYYRNDSVVELSHVPKVDGQASHDHDDNVSFDTTRATDTIRVKQEWSISSPDQP